MKEKTAGWCWQGAAVLNLFLLETRAK